MLKKKILIAGGTGLIGRSLKKHLTDRNYETVILSRKKGDGVIRWDPDSGFIDMDMSDPGGFHAVINLAGAGIADARWTPSRKKIIQESRVRALQTLHEALKKLNKKPEVFISASAVGYYGDRGDEILTEESRPGSGFLSETVILWEKAALPVSDLGIRTVLFRIGVVLAPDGGALKKMILPVKSGLGSPLGNGKQYVPFIHIDDLCNMFLFALENPAVQGIYNAAAPKPVTNAELTREIAALLRRPVFLPNVPSFVLKMILGELSHLVLDSTNVSSEKVQKAGFRFQYPEIRRALQSALKHNADRKK